MKRREFIQKSVGAGLMTGAALSFGSVGNLLANTSSVPDLPYDMIAIKGGEPEAMFDKAIASLGGMSKFVKKNQTVVVKPNIGWDASPERAANTNPKLIARIIEHCFRAGAKEVYAFDNTCNEWTRCYKNSGIESAVKSAGGKMVPGNTQNYYQQVELKNGKSLKTTKIHELILSSDVFINVPVLKNHGGATLTVAMKNLMGIVWDRKYYHDHDLQQCIADFAAFRKPDLNIVDAYRVMKRNGPRGVSVADITTMKYQLISPDIVAIDTAAAKVFGIQPQQVRHIALAEAEGAGTSNLDSLRINRLTI